MSNQVQTAVAVAPDTSTKLSPRRHPQRPAITINPEKLSGTPTIAGKR